MTGFSKSWPDAEDLTTQYAWPDLIEPPPIIKPAPIEVRPIDQAAVTRILGASSPGLYYDEAAQFGRLDPHLLEDLLLKGRKTGLAEEDQCPDT
jgi:hypothetical protein